MLVKIPPTTRVRKISARLPNDTLDRYEVVEAQLKLIGRKLDLDATLSQYLQLRIAAFEREVAKLVEADKAEKKG